MTEKVIFTYRDPDPLKAEMIGFTVSAPQVARSPGHGGFRPHARYLRSRAYRMDHRKRRVGR